MKHLVFCLLLLGLAAPGTARERIGFDQLLADSCLHLENCENEGKLSRLTGQPLNEVVSGMCDLHLTIRRKFACYEIAFALIPYLRSEEIQRGYEGRYSLWQLRSYYKSTRRACTSMPSHTPSGEVRHAALNCWRESSRNLVAQIGAMLKSQQAKKPPAVNRTTPPA